MHYCKCCEHNKPNGRKIERNFKLMKNAIIIRYCEMDIKYDADLILDGLKFIYNKNKQ